MRVLVTGGIVSASEPRSSAARRLKLHAVFTLLVVAVALLITWLLLADNSPLTDFHGVLRKLWLVTVLFPYFLSALMSKNPHSPSLTIYVLALIVQWSIFGFFLSLPLVTLWLRWTKK